MDDNTKELIYQKDSLLSLCKRLNTELVNRSFGRRNGLCDEASDLIGRAELWTRTTDLGSYVQLSLPTEPRKSFIK